MAALTFRTLSLDAAETALEAGGIRGVDRIGTVLYDKLGGRIKTAVTYNLYAFDAAGNVSSPATLVITP